MKTCVNNEHYESLLQDLKSYETRNQGFWDTNLLVNYYWSTLRDTDSNRYKKTFFSIMI